MTLEEIEKMAQRIRTQNASVKFGHPKYTASIDSQSLLTLLNAVDAMAPVVRAVEHLCGPGGIDDPPRVLEEALNAFRSGDK